MSTDVDFSSNTKEELSLDSTVVTDIESDIMGRNIDVTYSSLPASVKVATQWMEVTFSAALFCALEMLLS